MDGWMASAPSHTAKKNITFTHLCPVFTSYIKGCWILVLFGLGGTTTHDTIWCIMKTAFTINSFGNKKKPEEKNWWWWWWRNIYFAHTTTASCCHCVMRLLIFFSSLVLVFVIGMLFVFHDDDDDHHHHHQTRILLLFKSQFSWI